MNYNISMRENVNLGPTGRGPLSYSAMEYINIY